MKSKKQLTSEQFQQLISTLKIRFEVNTYRHKSLEWISIEAKLETLLQAVSVGIDKLWSLNEMEQTGGEPDVIDYDEETGKYIFCDCSAESPKGRRSICYDHEALHARKENKPANSAINMAADMGIEILSEEEYRQLQSRQMAGNKFDTKTSSWVQTPAAIRKLGGALFCDYRYENVFLYHNGAESYYAARGFRGLLRV